MAGKKDLERLRRRKRRKQNIIRATVHFFVWAGVAVLYLSLIHISEPTRP